MVPRNRCFWLCGSVLYQVLFCTWSGFSRDYSGENIIIRTQYAS